MDETSEEVPSAGAPQYLEKDVRDKQKQSRPFAFLKGLGKRNVQHGAASHPVDPAMEAATEQLTLAEQEEEHRRAAWERQENQKAIDAISMNQDYEKVPYPGRDAHESTDVAAVSTDTTSDNCQNVSAAVSEPAPPESVEDAYARELHRKEEIEREKMCVESGRHYVPRPFPGDLHRASDQAKQAPKADGKLAELFGEQAYGSGQLNKNTSYRVGTRAAPPSRPTHLYPQSHYEAADLYSSISVQSAPQKMVSSQGMQSRSNNIAPDVNASKPGWAGIFQGNPNRSEAVNPFAGPSQRHAFQPGSHIAPQHPSHGVSHALTAAISPELVERLNQGRELAKLSLDNHETADHMRKNGKRKEANASYRAAEAGYHQALEILVPARRELDGGSEASRAVRQREKENLQKLISRLLDKWECVKPHVGPDVPTELPNMDADPDVIEDEDPLLARLQSSVADIGLNDKPGAFSAIHDYNGTGHFDLSSLPSVPTDEIPLPASPSPRTVRKCFVCISGIAEVVTPCQHYFCLSCSDSVISLYGNKCPQCEKPCSGTQLKSISAK